MERQVQANLIKTLLVGEVLFALGSIAFLGFWFPGIVFISILSVIGLGMSVFALARLRTFAKEFGIALYASIVALIFAFVADILLITGVDVVNNTVNPTILTCAAVFSALKMLTCIYIFLRILKGCRILINKVDKDDKFGLWVSLVYAIFGLAAIGLTIAISIININETYILRILSSVLVGVEVAAAITYVIALIRTHNSLA